MCIQLQIPMYYFASKNTNAVLWLIKLCVNIHLMVTLYFQTTLTSVYIPDLSKWWHSLELAIPILKKSCIIHLFVYNLFHLVYYLCANVKRLIAGTLKTRSSSTFSAFRILILKLLLFFRNKHKNFKSIKNILHGN